MLRRLYFLMIPLLLFSCGEPSGNGTSQRDWERIPIEYAKNFGLKRSGDLFLLELYEPGTTRVTQTIEIDPKKNKRIISLTATLNGMLCILDERQRIMGVSSKAYLYDKKLIEGVNQKRIQEFGDISKLSIEKIVANNPNLILYDFVKDKFPFQEKLERLNVHVLPINDWRESHPLAKAEWIKVVGAITGKFDRACAHFDGVVTRYNDLKEKAQVNMKHPTVLCGNMIGDAWYTPSGDNYFAQLIEDAGGSYRYASSNGINSLSLPLEQVLEENKHTAFWLNPGFPDKKSILEMNPHADLLLAWEDNTYCYSANMNKFWEQSAANPDKVLSDLVRLFLGDSIKQTSVPFNYYAKVVE